MLAFRFRLGECRPAVGRLYEPDKRGRQYATSDVGDKIALMLTVSAADPRYIGRANNIFHVTNLQLLHTHIFDRSPELADSEPMTQARHGC